MNSDSIKTTGGIKFTALLLIIGGLIGVGVGIWLGLLALEQAPITIIIAIMFVAIFLFCAYHGFGLWRGNKASLKWAKVIFTAQVPVISFSGFSYEFYTGFMLAVTGGEGAEPVSMRLGSAASLYFSPEVATTYYGINIIAIVILVYLLMQKKDEE